MSGSSARRRARRRRSARTSLLLVLVLAVTTGVVYAGIGNRSSDEPAASKPSPTTSTSPSSSVDLSRLPIERGEFCDLLGGRDVEDALGAPVSEASHYRSGDRVTLAPGVTDVAHEYDCTYEAADGAEARVWVFAEPVTATVGRSIVRDARRERGCSERPHAPTFGTPSIGTLCRTSKPASRSVTLRGLFGDAWLSCRLSTPGASGATETAHRADQWCVRVATTLGARP
jgi:hypothetical protein